MPSPSEPGATPEPTAPSEHKVRTLDPRSLRGLAHPLRMRLFRALRESGPATASQLAGRLDESSGATSYHLRQLAAYGFVEDAPEHGKGRERWWRATSQGIRLEPERLNLADPVQRGAIDVLMHEVADNHTEELSTWLGTRHEWPTVWQEAYDLSDYSYRLTPAQAVELRERAGELLESFRAYEAQNADAEDAAPYRVHLHGFPRDTSPSHPDPTEEPS
ncbi:ArsR/SmtB family transcription factor [Streptomyces albidoflavus]|uniref:ArsR/SmtB family transcription factor n=1 Tax=Streptomyces TaxID=1883 RepID=UPI00024945B1|nr:MULTISPECIES: helix-turn-helix domain-containing protein [Streptomyces]MCU7706712.1 helix-turn-helix domain-containing protein [Streptomyces albidoflavus]RZD81070.1 ArsR family transcriptional regulator [Streptomyces albidoflavus]RZD83432.1 ArsR family transcriptional regulator [Streptomyces albidoflavus]RZE00023.1 ArsR family transcriptional regulator [Streptomyces albidoflavus]